VNEYERIPELATQLLNRNARQIFDRYRIYRDPNISSNEFYTEENLKPIQHVHKFGKKWSNITKTMSDRIGVQLNTSLYNMAKMII
jgi:hypothetical protein